MDLVYRLAATFRSYKLDARVGARVPYQRLGARGSITSCDILIAIAEAEKNAWTYLTRFIKGDSIVQLKMLLSRQIALRAPPPRAPLR